MSEIDYDVADAITEVITDVAESPSIIARKAKVTTNQAHAALRWMVANEYVIAVGNGAWTKYRARRAGEYNRRPWS